MRKIKSVKNGHIFSLKIHNLQKGYEPEGWYYPGSDPEFTGTWISAKKGPIDSFSDKVHKYKFPAL